METSSADRRTPLQRDSLLRKSIGQACSRKDVEVRRSKAHAYLDLPPSFHPFTNKSGLRPYCVPQKSAGEVNGWVPEEFAVSMEAQRQNVRQDPGRCR